MVHAEPDGGVVLAAQGDEGLQRLTDADEFGGVFLVGVFQFLEGPGRVDKVARIDAHALAHLGGRHRGLAVEVDVGDERHGAVLAAQHVGNLADALGLFHALGREPHIVGSRIRYALALCRAGLHVVGGGVGHRLHPHGPLASQGDAANIDADSLAATIVESRIHDCYQ